MQKQYRLKRRNSYSYIYRKGLCVADSNLVLYYTRTKLGKKFGFSVSKKVGCAVVRNKVRRRLKEICRLNIDVFNNQYNFVFVAKPSCATKNYYELQASVLKLVAKTLSIN